MAVKKICRVEGALWNATRYLAAPEHIRAPKISRLLLVFAKNRFVAQFI